MTAPVNDTSTTAYQQSKPCCTICDRQKRCHVCGDQTLFACSNCQINFAATVYVCAKSACRDEHERKCAGDGRKSPDCAARPALPTEDEIAEVIFAAWNNNYDSKIVAERMVSEAARAVWALITSG